MLRGAAGAFCLVGFPTAMFTHTYGTAAVRLYRFSACTLSDEGLTTKHRK